MRARGRENEGEFDSRIVGLLRQTGSACRPIPNYGHEWTENM